MNSRAILSVTLTCTFLLSAILAQDKPAATGPASAAQFAARSATQPDT